jgi:hypothetical protein
MENSEIPNKVTRAMSRYRLDLPESDVIGRAGAGARRPRARLLIPAAILSLVVVALLVPRTGEVAFASWQAVPTPIDTALVADATPKCLPGGGTGGARLLVQDQRGPTAALVFIEGDQLIKCVASRGSSGSIESAVFGVGRAPAATNALAIVSGLSSPAGPTYPGLRVIVGTVPSQATSVTVRRTDGVVVTATVQNGWFLAWWPTPVKASVVTSLDAAGNDLQQLQDIDSLQ